MAAEVEQKESRSKKGHKKKRKKKRLGVRLDMTPMVDVAFLLLTFFMLTTAFKQPQAMEINLPPKDVTVPVAQSNVFTIRVSDAGTIYWNVSDEVPTKTAMTELHNLFVRSSQTNSKMVFLIKVDRKAKYTTMVDIMDELNLANINRFSIAPYVDADREEVAKAS